MTFGVCTRSAATGGQYSCACGPIAAALGMISTALFMVSPAHAQDFPTNNVDATASVENLGIPAAPYYMPKTDDFNIYPRNVWSLTPFDGRLYIGNGNSSNAAPSANAGPAPVLSYNPATNAVTEEYMTADEQVDVFRVINGELVIPGHDPLGSWAYGNFYRLRNGVWTQNRTIPGGVHNFDMVSFGGALWAGIGSTNGGAIDQSLDDGATWTEYDTVYQNSNRVYSLIPFQGNLYASSDAIDSTAGSLLNVWTGSEFIRLTTSADPPARAYHPESNAKVLRNLVFANKLVYIMAYQYNDEQSQPFALYTAATISTPMLVPLAAGEIPYDITASGDQLFVLTGTPIKTGGYTVQVRATADTISWPAVFHFTATTLPRSFALLNGDFYIGLGADPATVSNTAVLSPDTGTLLRIQGGALAAMPSAPAAPASSPITINEPTMPATLASNHVAVSIQDALQFNQATTGPTTLSWSIEDSAGVSYLTSHLYIPAVQAGATYTLVLNVTLRTGPSGDPLNLHLRLTDSKDGIAIDSHSQTTMAVLYGASAVALRK